MINIRNIYYMLAYAFQTLNVTAFKNVSTEKFDSAADLFAEILNRGISTQVKRGLGKEYKIVTDSLSAPKGKINLSDSVHLQATHARKLVCSYDELSENTYENQIIKATSLLLIRSSDVNPSRKKRLKKALLSFADVDDINARKIDWRKVKGLRLSPSYKMLLNVCRLVVDGMIQTTSEGNIKLASFVDDQRMSRLYEHFVLEFYRRHYPELKPTAAYIDWNVDDGVIDYLPAMKTDITLSNGTRTLIIDTKYYGHTMQTNPYFKKKTVHSGNLYQIYSYVKNFDKDKSGLVSGLLLYAKTDEEMTPDNTYMMDGNQICVRTLDLGVEFSEIKKQLCNIASSLL